MAKAEPDLNVKPLVLISAWFGPWPAWIELHLETCRRNTGVDWLLVTDQPPPSDSPPNVRYLRLTLPAFLARIGDTIGLALPADFPAYKLCDLKGAYGHVFTTDIAGYHSFGFNDLDVFFGDIRHFYTDALLARYDAISTHPDRVSGHLAVFRNTERLRTAYRRIPDWADKTLDPAIHALDERALRRQLRREDKFRRFFGLSRLLFEERFSTIDGTPWRDGTDNWPREWRWRDGRLTNTIDGDGTPYLYLHVMTWHSNRWRKAGPAPWPELPHGPVQVSVPEARAGGFAISPAGLHPIPA